MFYFKLCLLKTTDLYLPTLPPVFLPIFMNRTTPSYIFYYINSSINVFYSYLYPEIVVVGFFIFILMVKDLVGFFHNNYFIFPLVLSNVIYLIYSFYGLFRINYNVIFTQFSESCISM